MGRGLRPGAADRPSRPQAAAHRLYGSHVYELPVDGEEHVPPAGGRLPIPQLRLDQAVYRSSAGPPEPGADGEADPKGHDADLRDPVARREGAPRLRRLDAGDGGLREVS